MQGDRAGSVAHGEPEGVTGDSPFPGGCSGVPIASGRRHGWSDDKKTGASLRSAPATQQEAEGYRLSARKSATDSSLADS